jgi:agmatinase
MPLPDDEWNPDDPAHGDGIFGLPHDPDEAAVRVIPVPLEATVSYRRGTAGGPAAILEASRQVDLHLPDHPVEAWRAGIALERVDPQIADWCAVANGSGDPREIDVLCERIHEAVYARARAALERGQIPGILGGDHSVAFGGLRAAAERIERLGVLHVDAHLDLREAYQGHPWSHASVFHNVLTRLPVARLVSVGIRDVGRAEVALAQGDPRVSVVFDEAPATWPEVVALLPVDVWVSFDIDGLDPSLCPNTGTPVPGGLGWRDAMTLLRVLSGSGRRIVGFDLCEVAPGPGGGEWDANVGARLLYRIAASAIATRGLR